MIEQRAAKVVGAMAVERALPPTGGHEFGNDDPTLFAVAVGEATAEEEVDDLHGGGHAQVA